MKLCRTFTSLMTSDEWLMTACVIAAAAFTFFFGE